MSAERFGAQWRRLPHPIRWVVAASVGGSLVVVGLVLLVLPGPGIPILLAGLLVLATEFAWAEATLRRVKKHGESASRMARRAVRRARRTPTPTMNP